MLPFVVGGGILIALAFLIDGQCVDINLLSEAERANFGTITPEMCIRDRCYAIICACWSIGKQHTPHSRRMPSGILFLWKRCRG